MEEENRLIVDMEKKRSPEEEEDLTENVL